MRFRTAGNPESKKVLLIHAMFVTPDSFSALVERLEKDYFIIMPTLGTKEPARLCTFRLRRYKSGSIVKKKGYRHCGYLLSHPDEYAEMLKNK